MGGGGKKRGAVLGLKGEGMGYSAGGENWNRMIFRSHSCGTSNYHIGTKAG